MTQEPLEEILKENGTGIYSRGDSREQNSSYIASSLETDNYFLVVVQDLHRWKGFKGPMWDENQTVILGDKNARKTFRLASGLISTNAITRPKYELEELTEKEENIHVKYVRGDDIFEQEYTIHKDVKTIPEKKEDIYTLKEVEK